MLVKAELHHINEYADIVYPLALDQTRSSYHTFADGIKTRDDFIKASERAVLSENYELLLRFSGDEFMGWISYFTIPEDNYLQLTAFNMVSDTEKALDEFIAYLQPIYPGYTLYFGFPGVNTRALDHLEESGFECIERDWNNVFIFPGEKYIPGGDTVRITKENYDLFRSVHSQADEDTYWNCDRIFEKLSDWVIFVRLEDGVPAAAVFFSGREGAYEIFGLEFKDKEYDEESCEILLSAVLAHLSDVNAKNLTFFCEQEMLPAVKKLGFRTVGEYVLYIKKI